MQSIMKAIGHRTHSTCSYKEEEKLLSAYDEIAKRHNLKALSKRIEAFCTTLTTEQKTMYLEIEADTVARVIEEMKLSC